MVNELQRILLGFWKKGSVLLINKFLLFQYSEGICSVSTEVMVLKYAQHDYVVTLFLARIKLAIISRGMLGNQRMNIETIEKG